MATDKIEKGEAAAPLDWTNKGLICKYALSVFGTPFANYNYIDLEFNCTSTVADGDGGKNDTAYKIFQVTQKRVKILI